MRLTAGNLAAVKSTGVLPVFGYALVVAFAIGIALGGFVGWKWTAGAKAMEENAQLRADAKGWAHIAARQRQNTTDQAAEIDAAIARLNAISQGREDDREAIRKFAAQLGVSLEKAAAANPALRDLDLGDEFLRHWNEANAGPGATVPAAGTTGQPGAAVPGTSGGDERQRPRDPSAARSGGDPLPRLPQRQCPLDRGSARMARDRMGLVLRRRSEGREQTGWLHG